MPGQPAEPLSPPLPRWVGLAAHLAPDPGKAWLRPNDAAHARMLRHLGARALHEPLLTVLPAGPLAGDGSTSLAASAGRALRALLPGQPKPVAALTRSPEVTGLLLALLGADTDELQSELRQSLAAQVLFSLALTDALREPVVLAGPLALAHTATRRGLTLHAGQQLALGGPGPTLDERMLDPWGPALGSAMVEQHGLALPRDALSELGELGPALDHIAAEDPYAESVTETLVALEVAGAAGATHAALGLPLAIGRARLPARADAPRLAQALLRESALQKLAVLRLVDPLVHDEAALPGLLAAVDVWVARRLGLTGVLTGSCPREALTSLGQQVLDELAI